MIGETPGSLQVFPRASLILLPLRVKYAQATFEAVPLVGTGREPKRMDGMRRDWSCSGDPLPPLQLYLFQT